MIGPPPVYPQINPQPTAGRPARPERRGVSRRSIIDAAKKSVPVIDLADLLTGPGGLRRSGKEWFGRCPLPDHPDKTPSFTVNPDKNLFYCHGCLRGGDVVELARYAWGYEKSEVAMAAADLLHEFGHEIPERPKSWFRRQERQKPVRDAAEEVRKAMFRRRVFEALVLPYIARIEDAEERRAEINAAWTEFEGSMVRIGR